MQIFQHHLHSTMFIFIFNTIYQIKRYTKIYIPLCLYLYPYLGVQQEKLIGFTFHYVYIYMN